MPTLEEIRYSSARDKIDKHIRDSSLCVKNEIKEIVNHRASSMLCLMKEWAIKYSDKIRLFTEYVNIENLADNIGFAYKLYMEYSFIYRLMNGLDNNILFRKIYSFELHFFSRSQILSKMPNQLANFDNQTDDERLFYINPLGHFMYYRFFKEFHVTPSINLIETQDKIKLYTQLLTAVRTSFIEFFGTFSSDHIIGIDDFRIFIGKPTNNLLDSMFKKIESRDFDII